MILFINPLNSFLTKSSKTAKLVYFGVQLIPTPESNKSLQVSGLYYGRLLSFIKHYIDEAITEMEAPEAIPHTEEIAAPYSNSSEPKIEALGVESVETPMTPQKPEIVNTEAVEVGETEDTEVVEVGEIEEDIEDWPIPEAKPTPNNSKEVSVDEVIDFQSADAIAILLECQTKLQLMAKKKDIGEELVKKAWDEMTLIQKNYLQLISLRENVTKPMGTLGYQLLYQPTKDSQPRKARLIGFYLYGDKLPQADERAVLLDGETQPTVCSKADLRPFKNSAKATEAEIKLLEKLLSEPQETEPTAETMSANTFTGLATAPKPQTGIEIGSQPDSEPSKPSVAETIINHLKLA